MTVDLILTDPAYNVKVEPRSSNAIEGRKADRASDEGTNGSSEGADAA